MRSLRGIPRVLGEMQVLSILGGAQQLDPVLFRIFETDICLMRSAITASSSSDIRKANERLQLDAIICGEKD
jgi:hypothetical protein